MRFVRAYNYVDENGVLLFQVVRWRDPKSFSQRQPDGRGGWRRDQRGKLTMAGCRMVPYHLDLLAAAARELAEHGVMPLAHIAEGEKDSDRLIRGGCLATTAAGGAGKWNPEFARYFENFECVLLPDNDDVGRRHMAEVARSLLSVASWVKIVQLPVENKGGDFSDWADAGGTRHALKALIAATRPLTLADLPPPAAMPKRQPGRLPDRLSPYARSAIERAVKAIGAAPQGQQQKTLNTEAYGVGQLAGAGLLPEGESLTRLLNAAADMLAYDPRRPWRPAELDRAVRRAFEQGLRLPRGIPAERTRTGSRYGR